MKAWRQHDPNMLFEARLLEIGSLDDDSLAELKAQVKREVDASTDASELAEFPDPASFDRYVYAER